jgi:GTP cyclohydrolase I
VDSQAISRAVRDILIAVGEDPSREGLGSTPDRVAELFTELYAGVGVDPVQVLRDAKPVASSESERGELVALRDIAFHSICEHHLLPFEGSASVVYAPAGAIVGLGTLATLVEVSAARPSSFKKDSAKWWRSRSSTQRWLLEHWWFFRLRMDVCGFVAPNRP